MAGYSGTPLPKKLGLREGHRLALVGAPDGFLERLGDLPDGISLVHVCSHAGLRPGCCELRAGAFDVAVLFVRSRADLARHFPKLKARLDPAGGLWVAWPKRASGVATDMTEDVAREIGLPTGLVDNKVCAIDDVWSGLRFVVRVADRAPAAKPRKRPASAAKPRAPTRRG